MKTNKIICAIACAMIIMMTACGNTEVKDADNISDSSTEITAVEKEDENEVVTDTMDSSACEDDSSRIDDNSSSRPDDSSKTDSSSKNESSSKKDKSSSKAANKKSDSSSKSSSKSSNKSSGNSNSSGGNGNANTSQKNNSGGNNSNSGSTNNNGNTGNSNNTQPVQNDTQPVVNYNPEPATTPPPQTVSDPTPQPEPVQLTEDGYDPREYARLRGGALVHTNKPYDGFANDIHYYLSWVNDLSDVELAYFNFDMGCMTDRDWQIICDDCWNYIHERYKDYPNIKIENTDEFYVVFDENGNCLDWKGGFGYGVGGRSFYHNDKGEVCVDENNIPWYYEDFLDLRNQFYEEIKDVIDSFHFTKDDTFTLRIHLNYYYNGLGDYNVFVCQV
ncbi:hypothetical protein [Ruminococcus albus]|uniref:Uncharacterized protein n=1 Tax=Ruminococcus albus (strain ATCC 27210 / DSM 20455 / JCM 14654 / NCDO 2250 / 7) TaxID=697329 RepID=E6UJT8_RUMA7|nr:hypothetical protein [Ruminococcus albus]ADU23934.1 hypothetical protein Rumal_3487 [Ruminococcus albus 7 = DSM 20455]